jgi:hypothetical protein
MRNSLHRSIEARIEEFTALLNLRNPDFLEGFYLVGSAALGDFQPGRSDIDFVAITVRPFDAADLDCLEEIHTHLKALPGPIFDGFYIDLETLRQSTVPGQNTPFVLDGTFHRDEPCFEVNPVTWRLLRERGITIKGPLPADLPLVIDREHLRQFEVENLNGYWAGWLHQFAGRLSATGSPGDIDAATVTWGALGIARLACVLSTDEIVSKTEAGLWLLDAYPERWHRVVNDCLKARRGEIATFSIEHAHAALQLMEHLLGAAQKFKSA